MTRTRIILAATAALLTAGLSACNEGGSPATGAALNAQSPESAVRSADTEEPSSETTTSASATTTGGSSPKASTANDPAQDDSAPQLCHVANLTVTAKYVDAGAGSQHLGLQFINTGNSSCEIQGFPGVSYVGGDDGHQVGRAAARAGDKGSAITLTPGALAWAPLSLPHAENFDPADCQPERARGLRIYPPQEYESLFVPLEETACANPDLPGEQLTVQTIQQGSPS